VFVCVCVCVLVVLVLLLGGSGGREVGGVGGEELWLTGCNYTSIVHTHMLTHTCV